MEGAARNTLTAIRFEKLPGDYAGLVNTFMPRAIHDEVDYANTLEVIDALAGHDLTDEQELYLDTLATLVEAYEKDHHDMRSKKLSGVEALRFLMDQHQMTAADLGTLLGERTVGSKVLRGERKIGLTYARILARRFAVDIGLFLT
ncbi:MAG TPA: transcriptional regulator [Phycisphaerae bacterium]|nr:transcriptional regulator [Phycisphaerae bacterium]